MKNLKMWQKLALTGVVLLAPFAVVTYKLTTSIEAVGIESARLELRGLAYTAPALTLVKDLQLHRGFANASLHGIGAFNDALAANTADLENDIKALDEANRRDGLAVGAADRWTKIRAACIELLSKASELSPEQSFARHSKIITDIIALVAHVGHDSNLTLDPDADRKRLIDILVLQGPELSEALGRARGLGALAATTRKHSADDAEGLHREAVLVEFLGAKIDESIAETLEANAALKAQLDEQARNTSSAVLEAMGEIVRLARGDNAGQTPAQYFAAVTRGIDAIHALNARIAATLRQSLDERMAALWRELFTTLGWVAVGLVVVLAAGLLIMRDVTLTLGQVVGVANAIAIGDLSVPTVATSRQDEIGVLANAFDKMLGALKETVGMAERIAAGDLAVTVTPRSDRDVMGKALAHMVGRLSALVGDVQQSGLQVNSSVNQIAATAKQQQATTTEIAATTSEIRATSKQISVTSHELFKTMNEVSAVADESAALAGSGQEGLQRMEATMRQVIDAAAIINTRLSVLNEKAGGITQVVTTIAKVADQTNLLSLNAAIEAEKAGEYGRGFAVVATEIRRLADQTAVATFDIEQMVREIQTAVSAGVMSMDKFSEEVRRGMQDMQQVGDQLSRIIHQVQTLAPRFQAVNEGMHAQATGAEQITNALAQLGDAVQQTLESLRESNHVIDGLNHAASGMRSGVARFKVVA